MWRKVSRKSPGRLKAWVLAVALHLLVVGLLVIAFRWPLPSAEDVQIIEAVAVDEQQAEEAERKQREAERRERERAEAEKRKAEAERKRKEEQKRLAAERQRKEEEKRLAAERQRKDEERERKLEAERKRQEEERKKAEQEQQRLEEEKQRLAEERQRLEEERQRIAEQRKQREDEERRRKEAEEQLAAMVAEEERQREEQARRLRALTAAEKYKVLIRQKVTRNWARPADTQKGLVCTVRVRLVPTGEVLEVKVVRSSGNDLFDRSVENAVYKASPLPLPEERDLFEYFREIEFLFNPEG